MQAGETKPAAKPGLTKEDLALVLCYVVGNFLFWILWDNGLLSFRWLRMINFFFTVIISGILCTSYSERLAEFPLFLIWLLISQAGVIVFCLLPKRIELFFFLLPFAATVNNFVLRKLYKTMFREELNALSEGNEDQTFSTRLFNGLIMIGSVATSIGFYHLLR